MSLSNPELKNTENRGYQRTRKIQTRNPLCQQYISEECKICHSSRGRKKQYHSLNKLYGHYLSHHRITLGIFESNEEFEIRKQQSFDYKQYLLSLADRLLMEVM